MLFKKLLKFYLQKQFGLNEIQIFTRKRINRFHYCYYNSFFFKLIMIIYKHYMKVRNRLF